MTSALQFRHSSSGWLNQRFDGRAQALDAMHYHAKMFDLLNVLTTITQGRYGDLLQCSKTKILVFFTLTVMPLAAQILQECQAAFGLWGPQAE